MRLERRLRALETRMIADPVVLYFEDGSTRKICGRGDFLLGLMLGACGGAVNPLQTAQLDLIRRCVSASESGGGHMVELLRSLLTGPADELGNR
jgi:hypothetical protein